MFGLMQPYFFPYIGYFQLIQKCEKFVIYDDVQFTKKGWLNRNILRDSKSDWNLTLNVNQSSKNTLISEKSIAKEFNVLKILSRIENDYSRTPFFKENINEVKSIFGFENENVSKYLYETIRRTCIYLDIDAQLIISSEITDTSQLKGKEKIFKISKSLNEKSYLNNESGAFMYRYQDFIDNGLQLSYLRPNSEGFTYSIIDTLFNIGREATANLAKEGQIIPAHLISSDLNSRK